MPIALGIGIGIPFNTDSGSGGVVINNAILLEDGVNFIELEDNSGVILLES